METHSLQQELQDIQDPRIFERNQVEPHTTLMPYADLEQALNHDRQSSPYCSPLNGDWKFNWSENLDQAPVEFYRRDYPVEDWDEITVPSCWQMEGYGHPKFRNTVHPFPSQPPRVPSDYNPVGCYVRSFDLPEDWEDRQVFLHFDGVKSASYVWINGRKVGYNQGGMEPAEYDVTDFLKPGNNRIAVKVIRYCDGTYLECQDMWRLAGIYRDVYLMATPKIHLRDIFVWTEFDDQYRDADLKVKVDVSSYRGPEAENYSLRLQLYDDRGQSVVSSSWTEGLPTISGHDTLTMELMRKVAQPQQWSAEHPNLYTLTVELMDPDQETTELIEQRIGFREVEIRNQALYVNGVPVKLNGVNSHMQHPETGRKLDRETMRRDLTLMKRFNINCVRTSHYPPNIEYLELADELGIYIIDETGDEAHANEHLSQDPDWKDQYLDRMRKMVCRDRNHPAVIMWSAGNESGWGDNICTLIAAGKEIDPTRPGWMYGGNRDTDPATNPISCEDIVGPRYLKPFTLKNRFAQVREDEDPRPSFMDEYLSAAGNSVGGLDEYWKVIYDHRRTIGGAIWDWVSPGIRKPVVTVPDHAPDGVKCSLMGGARLVECDSRPAVDLSGHDEWVEVYRSPGLDITGDELTLSLWVYPRQQESEAALLTKGGHQYGLEQSGAELRFYVGGAERVTLTAPVPADWSSNWHHLVAIYDQGQLRLYIDGQKEASCDCSIQITNTPFPVNLGRNAERHGQDFVGYLFQGLMAGVRIFEGVVPMDQLVDDSLRLEPEARLWLDFEDSSTEGDFYSLGIGARSYGIVWPDRTFKPSLWQIKKSAQPVAAAPVDLAAGQVRVINRHHFKSLDELDVFWSLTENGETVQGGRLRLDTPPREEEVVEIPYELPAGATDCEYHLLLRFCLSEDMQWASRGHEVAWEQFELSCVPGVKPQARLSAVGADNRAPSPGGEGINGVDLNVEEAGELLAVTGDGFTYHFNRATGLLESGTWGQRPLIVAGPRFNAWRAPLANELDSWPVYRTEMGMTREGMGLGLANGWRSLGLDNLNHRLNSFSLTEQTGDRVKITAETSVHAHNYRSGFAVRYCYTVEQTGLVKLTLKTIPAGNMTHWLPRIGLKMQLPRKYRALEWFGRGPHENYPDRKSGARVGRYTSTVEEEYQPYLIPQDYGNKTDVRWVALTADDGNGLYVTGDELLQFSAHHFSTDNLSRAGYTFQLEEDEAITLNIDHRVSGVGGTSISTLNQYRVLPRVYEFTVYLFPLSFGVRGPDGCGELG